MAQEAEILPQFTSGRQGIGHSISNRLVVDPPLVGVAQEENLPRGMDEQDVLQRVPLFLAAITTGLFTRVLGARHGTLGAIV